jgi:CheY-like chemotaxis protein
MLLERERYARGTAPRVLLAEDDSNDELLLRLAFNRAAPEVLVLTFGDGVELTGYLERYPPGRTCLRASLLLLDLKMPRMDGFSVLHWLVHRPELRPDRIVVLTANGDPTAPHQASRLGADAFLSKPENPLALVEVVRSLRNCWTRSESVNVHASDHLRA